VKSDVVSILFRVLQTDKIKKKGKEGHKEGGRGGKRREGGGRREGEGGEQGKEDEEGYFSMITSLAAINTVYI
jgi:hypothetical protein